MNNILLLQNVLSIAKNASCYTLKFNMNVKRIYIMFQFNQVNVSAKTNLNIA